MEDGRRVCAQSGGYNLRRRGKLCEDIFVGIGIRERERETWGWRRQRNGISARRKKNLGPVSIDGDVNFTQNFVDNEGVDISSTFRMSTVLYWAFGAR